MYPIRAAGKVWQIVPQLAASINDTMSSRRGMVIGYAAFPIGSTGGGHPHFTWREGMTQDEIDVAAQRALSRFK